MTADSCDGTKVIVDQFARWVKSLAGQLSGMQPGESIRPLESRVRDEGHAILAGLLRGLLQEHIDRHQEQLRICPDCQWRRRHQGVRSRQLDSSLGSLELHGIYFKCMACGSCQHSVDLAGQEPLTELMRDLVLLAGVSAGSFDKAEVLTRHLLGVRVDDEAVRQLCLKEGNRQQVTVTPVPAGKDLLGSCDGTMVHTRQSGWREIKAMYFRHEAGAYASAYLEDVRSFAPRLQHAALRLGHRNAGRCVFVSDCAEWISGAVKQQLPGFIHVADYFHAVQHVHQAGEAVYGREHPDAAKWSRSVGRRLREQGASALADRLRRLALYYRDLTHQRAVLDLCRYLDKHSAKMQYKRFREQHIPIDSGMMESFCKQLGLRLKGPGMRWNVANVNAMANLVSRWATDPEHAFTAPHKPPCQTLLRN